MNLSHGLQLCYSTNIHRGESWAQTLDALQKHTLAVREQVCPEKPYAIGLRLSDAASRELSDRPTLLAFQQWLEKHNCYVFTINGFPFGQFHGTRVKEQVYVPDWTSPERVAYTNRLFDLLAELVPAGLEGSVSTAPGSFKEFIHSPEQERAMRDNVWRSVEHIAKVSERCGKLLHLGLEPEPLCYLETSEETAEFFSQLRDEHPRDERLRRHLGVNYDTCHLAVEFEEAPDALRRFAQNDIKISKLHFSSALKARPVPAARETLGSFVEDTYLHQVVSRARDGSLTRYRDLDAALASPGAAADGTEWRIHFHIPLHSKPGGFFDNTTDHLLQVMDALQAAPSICSHLEMETYTWEVMPGAMKNRSVVDQLVAEHRWCLGELAQRGIQLA